MSDRQYEVVVLGSTGFTGRLVAEYLLKEYGVDQDLKWAMGGRNEGKLKSIRAMLGDESIPLVVCDSKKPEDVDNLAKSTKVVCTTVGPYSLYGSELVAACVANGTHYCDLAGEVQWMRRMIDQHHETAKANGAKIVHTCGFDSIPSDMGVYFVQNAIKAKTSSYADHIKMRVRVMKGKFSGGTIASMNNMMVEAQKDPSIYKVLSNPYSLNPDGERTGPDKKDLMTVKYDKDIKQWLSPFVMAGINTKVVRRSNALAGYPYGKDFLYDEAMSTGDGIGGRIKSTTMAAGLGILMGGKPGSLWSKTVNRFLPDPGEGPTKEERETGFYVLDFFGKMADGSMITGKVTGDRDPGYGSTSKMLAESAVCLAKDNLSDAAGMLTPAVAMGDALLDRLVGKAGLTFEMKE